MKVLLDSGATSNFILDTLATALKLKIHSDVDFHDLTLADGSIVWTAGYVQFTLTAGSTKAKSSPGYFLTCIKIAFWGCLGWSTKTP